MPPIIIAAGIAATAATIGVAAKLKGDSDARDASDKASADSIAAEGSNTDKSIAAQREMTDKAAAALKEQADIARSELAPFRESQLNALNQLNGLGDINNPLYQQQRAVNTQAIQRQLAAQGLLRSKKQSDLLSNLELGLDQQRTGVLQGLAGTGAVQASAQVSQGLGSSLSGLYGNLGANIGSSFQNFGNNLAGIYQNMGNTRAQLAMANGQAIGGYASNLNNIVQGTYGNYLSQQQNAQQMALLQQLLASNGGGAAPAYTGSVGGKGSVGEMF